MNDSGERPGGPNVEMDSVVPYAEGLRVPAHPVRPQRTPNELQAVPRTWRTTFDMSDRAPRPAPEEAAAPCRGRAQVVARHRRDTPKTAARAPGGTEQVAAITQILPEVEVPAALSLASGPQEEEGSPTS